MHLYRLSKNIFQIFFQRDILALCAEKNGKTASFLRRLNSCKLMLPKSRVTYYSVSRFSFLHARLFLEDYTATCGMCNCTRCLVHKSSETEVSKYHHYERAERAILKQPVRVT